MGKKAMLCLLLDNLSDDEHRAICETGFAPPAAQLAYGEMLANWFCRPPVGESKSTYSRFYLQHDETIRVLDLIEPEGPSEKASTPKHPIEEMKAFRPRPDRTSDQPVCFEVGCPSRLKRPIGSRE